MSRPLLSFKMRIPAESAEAARSGDTSLLFKLPREVAHVLDFEAGSVLIVDITTCGTGELVRRRISGRVLELSDRMLSILPEDGEVSLSEATGHLIEDFLDIGDQDTIAGAMRAAAMLLEVERLVRITWKDRMPWCELTDEGRAMRAADRERSARCPAPTKNETNAKEGGGAWVH